MNFKETLIGFEYCSPTHLIFFGNKNADLEILKKTYPQYEFRSLRQTHSDILIKSSSDSFDLEADAHWTEEKNKALVIRTADCIPCLIIENTSQDILAIHAGWKGVENKIIEKSISQLKWKNISVFWGPHILQDSFEVDGPVNNQLLQSGYNLSVNVSKKVETKFYVDLLQIAQSQIKQISKAQEFFYLFDTKKNLKFNSYRREKTNAGRNLSFIVKL